MTAHIMKLGDEGYRECDLFAICDRPLKLFHARKDEKGLDAVLDWLGTKEGVTVSPSLAEVGAKRGLAVRADDRETDQMYLAAAIKFGTFVLSQEPWEKDSALIQEAKRCEQMMVELARVGSELWQRGVLIRCRDITYGLEGTAPGEVCFTCYWDWEEHVQRIEIHDHRLHGRYLTVTFDTDSSRLAKANLNVHGTWLSMRLPDGHVWDPLSVAELELIGRVFDGYRRLSYAPRHVDLHEPGPNDGVPRLYEWPKHTPKRRPRRAKVTAEMTTPTDPLPDQLNLPTTGAEPGMSDPPARSDAS